MNEWIMQIQLHHQPPSSNHKAASVDFHHEAPGTETLGQKAPEEFQTHSGKMGAGPSGFQQLMDVEGMERL